MLASAAVLASTLLLALTAPARAGTYTIDNCPAAPAANGDSGPWTVYGATQGDKASCSAGPGDWIGPRGGSMSANSTDGVQVAVPAGSAVTIREAKLWWYVPAQISGATTFAIAASFWRHRRRRRDPIGRPPDTQRVPAGVGDDKPHAGGLLLKRRRGAKLHLRRGREPQPRVRTGHS